MRAASVVVLVACASALSTASLVRLARAESPRAVATCERIAGPGRVKCEAEIIAPAGGAVQWADVLLVETPSFVSALKGRIGPADTTLREKERWRFTFGLVARARGSGSLKLNVRAVVCTAPASGPERCEAQLVPVVVSVVAGQ